MRPGSKVGVPCRSASFPSLGLDESEQALSETEKGLNADFSFGYP